MNNSQVKMISTTRPEFTNTDKRTWTKPSVVSKSNMNAAENGPAKQTVDYQAINNGAVTFATS